MTTLSAWTLRMESKWSSEPQQNSRIDRLGCVAGPLVARHLQSWQAEQTSIIISRLYDWQRTPLP